MILINNKWEQIKDIEDGLKIIEDNLGKEFAQKFIIILLNGVESKGFARNKFINKLYKFIGLK